MMTSLSCDVLTCLQGKSLATAESCTGGMIGAALTAIPGSSAVYKGGIISYCNEVKSGQLGVSASVLREFGAVSTQVAEQMALGAREKLSADVAISVTGLAGPDGDDFGNPVGTVYIGYSDSNGTFSKKFLFSGARESVRAQAAAAALRLILEMN